MVRKIDEDMISKVDLSINAVYVVCDGHIIQLDTPPNGYGKQEISWQKGMPTHSEIKYTQKF